MNITTKERFWGSLLGLAIGDVIGAPVEMCPPGTFKPVTGMPFGKRPCLWTDDTAMALCLAESLIECQGQDLMDQTVRYLLWYRLGYMSGVGRCVGIGGTTRKALTDFENTGVVSPVTDSTKEGNGPIMRLAPVALFYSSDLPTAARKGAESSLTTHAAPNCISSSAFLSALIAGAAQGFPKEELLRDDFAEAWGVDLTPATEEIALGGYKTKNPPDIKGTGHVVTSLEAALWCFYTTDNYRDGVLKAVNLGHDTDTTAAIFGQLAGAYYGIRAIPTAWIKRLEASTFILDMADELYTVRYQN